MSVSQMREKCKDIGRPIEEEASSHEVEEMYDAEMAEYKSRNYLLKKILLPILPSFAFEGASLEFFAMFDLNKAAQIVEDCEIISDELVPSLNSLYAGFVEYNGVRFTKFDSPYYNALPSMFVNFFPTISSQ